MKWNGNYRWGADGWSLSSVVCTYYGFKRQQRAKQLISPVGFKAKAPQSKENPLPRDTTLYRSFARLRSLHLVIHLASLSREELLQSVAQRYAFPKEKKRLKKRLKTTFVNFKINIETGSGRGSNQVKCNFLICLWWRKKRKICHLWMFRFFVNRTLKYMWASRPVNFS